MLTFASRPPLILTPSATVLLDGSDISPDLTPKTRSISSLPQAQVPSVHLDSRSRSLAPGVHGRQRPCSRLLFSLHWDGNEALGPCVVCWAVCLP